MILGSGGREHALAWSCHRSRLKPELYTAPGNGGTAGFCTNVVLDLNDSDAIVEFAITEGIRLVVVGPEAPLVAGIADELATAGVMVFGPTRAAAQLEGSKSYVKHLLRDLKLPTADYETFTSFPEAKNYIDHHRLPLVVKASGLAAGKGAIICDSTESALKTAEDMLVNNIFGSAGSEIIVEEFIPGRELSLIAIVDGEDYLLLPPSRDHKRAFDGDKGLNTGGMGAYSPVEDVSLDEAKRIAALIYPPVLKKMVDSGTPYQGFLFAGVMLTSDGPNVLEFNCRFGDPEAQAILPLLSFDLLEVILEVCKGGFRGWISSFGFDPNDWSKTTNGKHAVTVVIAAEGYPGNYKKGMYIENLPPETANVIPYHAGTFISSGSLKTNGGRIITVTGMADTHDAAVNVAYQAVEQVQIGGTFYRSDIGREPF
ncbi:phosphoribosylamine--glycine ligase [Calditrichota bacterium]